MTLGTVYFMPLLFGGGGGGGHSIYGTKTVCLKALFKVGLQ